MHFPRYVRQQLIVSWAGFWLSGVKFFSWSGLPKVIKIDRFFTELFNKKFSYRWQTARRVQRSVKVTKHGTISYVRYSFLLVFYSNFVPKTVDFKYTVTLKTGLGVRQGHW